MLRFLINFVILIFISQCVGQTTINYNKYTFSIDNANPGQFGYENFEMDEDIAPKSIILKDTVAYIIDTYHSSIKKVNTNSGKIEASIKLSPKNIWLRDIITFMDKLIVSSDLDTLYILDYNLKLIKCLYTEKDDKYFFKRDNSVNIYFNNKNQICEIDSLYEIKKCVDNSYEPFNSAHGKEYVLINSDSSSFVKTPYFKIKLHEIYPKLYKEFNAINLDYDESQFCYYDVNERVLTLYIYKVN